LVLTILPPSGNGITEAITSSFPGIYEHHAKKIFFDDSPQLAVLSAAAAIGTVVVVNMNRTSFRFYDRAGRTGFQAEAAPATPVRMNIIFIKT
jgi:hypothetical protein